MMNIFVTVAIASVFISIHCMREYRDNSQEASSKILHSYSDNIFADTQACYRDLYMVYLNGDSYRANMEFVYKHRFLSKLASKVIFASF